MAEMQKITFEIQADKIKEVMRITGKGITETMREAVDQLLRREAGRRLSEMRGKIDLGLDYGQVKKDRNWDER